MNNNYGLFIIPELRREEKKTLLMELKRAGLVEKDRMGFKSMEDAEECMNNKFSKFKHGLEVSEYGYL